MKKLKIFILTLILVPCILFTSACAVNFETQETEKNCVVNIEKTDTGVNSDTYLVTYADETTTSITIKHGQDGLDGQNLTMEELEKYCEEKGISLDEFIEKHVTVEVKMNSIATASAKALKSTVNVYTTAGTGAGVIYKMEETYSYIITNYHVVYNTKTHSVSEENLIFLYGYEYTNEPIKENTFANAKDHGAINCEYVGGSLNYDIAVLKAKTDDIKTLQPSACAVTVATSYAVGDEVLAIGNPSGLGTSISSGCVSVHSEMIAMVGSDNSTNVNIRVLRTDTSVNPGNSGGGLFNISGDLIGIVNAKTVAQNIDNINYALPFDNVTKVADNLIYNYLQTNSPSSVQKLLFGMKCFTDNYTSVFKETEHGTTVELHSKLNVDTVELNSLANKLGVMVNDKVVGASLTRGESTTEYNFITAYQALEFALVVRAGDTISLKLERSGEIVESNARVITSSNFTNVA